MPLPLLPWNERFIRTERRSQDLCDCALARALDLMIIGHVEQANRIVATLYHHDALQFENDEDMLRGMCFVWSYTGLWPSFILDPDPLKPPFQRSDFPGPLNADDIDAIMDKWQEDEREQYLPALNKDSSDFKSSTRSHSQSILLATLDTALSNDDEDKVKQLIRKHVVVEFEALSSDSDAYEDRYYAGDHGEKSERKPITNCRPIWPLLCSGFVAKELQLQDSVPAITAYVDDGIQKLEERFNKGRKPEFGHLDMAGLIRQLDKDSMYLYHSYVEGSTSKSEFAREDRTTLTGPPATEDEIRDLERRLGVTLADDYKSFLRVTSYFGDGPDDPFGYCHSPAHVEWSDTATKLGEDLSDHFLIPYGFASFDLMEEFYWPTGLKAFDISGGGDQGYVWVFGLPDIQIAIEAFDEVYDAASESSKRIYERAARDLYGGIEEMRSLDRLYVFWSRGELHPLPFKSFRDYIDHAAEHQGLFRAMDENDKMLKEREEGKKRKRDGGDNDDDDNSSDNDEDDNGEI